MLQTELIHSRDQWNAALRTLPYAHILQTWDWGEFKQSTTGWEPVRFQYKQGNQLVAMASVGIRRIGPLTVMYVPKGPVYADNNPSHWLDVVAHLEQFAKERRAVWLKVDPDLPVGTGLPGQSAVDDPRGQTWVSNVQTRGWRFSGDQVQFRNTLVIDLSASEEALMASFSQNTRRKIRVAEREGVTVRSGTAADLPLLYELYRVTGERDQFLTRPFVYYQEAWRRFIEAGLAHPLIAEVDGKAIAQVILFHFGPKCWYFYGASSNERRETMPNYLLQWEAMRWSKAQGYARYDMWGAPDEFVESDPLWGVYQFKQGFRGTVVRHVGAWDYAPSPWLYSAYVEWMPRVRSWMRRR